MDKQTITYVAVATIAIAACYTVWCAYRRRTADARPRYVADVPVQYCWLDLFALTPAERRVHMSRLNGVISAGTLRRYRQRSDVDLVCASGGVSVHTNASETIVHVVVVPNVSDSSTGMTPSAYLATLHDNVLLGGALASFCGRAASPKDPAITVAYRNVWRATPPPDDAVARRRQRSRDVGATGKKVAFATTVRADDLVHAIFGTVVASDELVANYGPKPKPDRLDPAATPFQQHMRAVNRRKHRRTPLRCEDATTHVDVTSAIRNRLNDGWYETTWRPYKPFCEMVGPAYPGACYAAAAQTAWTCVVAARAAQAAPQAPAAAEACDDTGYESDTTVATTVCDPYENVLPADDPYSHVYSWTRLLCADSAFVYAAVTRLPGEGGLPPGISVHDLRVLQTRGILRLCTHPRATFKLRRRMPLTTDRYGTCHYHVAQCAPGEQGWTASHILDRLCQDDVLT